MSTTGNTPAMTINLKSMMVNFYVATLVIALAIGLYDKFFYHAPGMAAMPSMQSLQLRDTGAAYGFTLSDDGPRPQGAPAIGPLVTQVQPGGAADKLGVRKGDIITAVKGFSDNGTAQTLAMMNNGRYGLKLSVWRDGQVIEVPNKRK